MFECMLEIIEIGELALRQDGCIVTVLMNVGHVVRYDDLGSIRTLFEQLDMHFSWKRVSPTAITSSIK